MNLPALTPATPAERERALSVMPPVRGPRRPPLSAGRLVYLACREWPQWLRPGSPAWQRFARRRRLHTAERRLRFDPHPISSGGTAPLPVVMLTGENYVVQTLYAMKSWLRHAGRPVAFTLVDDGTLDESAMSRLRRADPAIVFHTAVETERRLDDVLPAARYPVLRRLRLGYFHLRKVTDTFLTGGERRIVVDTDVLLHREPRELLTHFDAGRAFHFRDCADSYGVTVEDLGAIAGVPVRARVNSGCFAFAPAELDWDFLETVSTRLLALHGYSFYHEQALVAVLCAVLDAVELGDDYLVLPDEQESRQPTRAALHYLDGANNPRMLLSYPLLES